MVNEVNEVYEGFRLCFYCVQGIYIARPLLYNIDVLSILSIRIWCIFPKTRGGHLSVTDNIHIVARWGA
jgi:hypothetical protein